MIWWCMLSSYSYISVHVYKGRADPARKQKQANSGVVVVV